MAATPRSAHWIVTQRSAHNEFESPVCDEVGRPLGAVTARDFLDVFVMYGEHTEHRCGFRRSRVARLLQLDDRFFELVQDLLGEETGDEFTSAVDTRLHEDDLEVIADRVR